MIILNESLRSNLAQRIPPNTCVLKGILLLKVVWENINNFLMFMSSMPLMILCLFLVLFSLFTFLSREVLYLDSSFLEGTPHILSFLWHFPVPFPVLLHPFGQLEGITCQYDGILIFSVLAVSFLIFANTLLFFVLFCFCFFPPTITDNWASVLQETITVTSRTFYWGAISNPITYLSLKIFCPVCLSLHALILSSTFLFTAISIMKSWNNFWNEH